jgi:hypothetical protein
MRLHQLKVEFNPEHDRLLLQVSTDDGKEALLWLTRRCLRLLWPALLKTVQADPSIALQPDADARSALLGMRHEQAVQHANFSRPYEDRPRERPLGPDPLLVARIRTTRNPAGQCVLSLLPAKGQGVNLTLDDNLLHSLCRLLQTAVSRADWDVRLDLPQPLSAPADAEGARTLN